MPIRTEAGPQPLVITAEDALGNRAEHTVSVHIESVDWPFTGKLPLSKKKAKVEAPAMALMRAERDTVYARPTPDAQRTATMALPVHDSVQYTSPFGTYREYPDGKRSHHDAEDLSRKRGTPIYEAGDGTVALAHEQAVHGNAVLVDHGHKVVTLYSHLHTLEVESGQRVKTGVRLGAMPWAPPGAPPARTCTGASSSTR